MLITLENILRRHGIDVLSLGMFSPTITTTGNGDYLLDLNTPEEVIDAELRAIGITDIGYGGKRRMSSAPSGPSRPRTTMSDVDTLQGLCETCGPSTVRVTVDQHQSGGTEWFVARVGNLRSRPFRTPKKAMADLAVIYKQNRIRESCPHKGRFEGCVPPRRYVKKES